MSRPNLRGRSVRELASNYKSSDIAGDGTTTATVLAAAIVREAQLVAAGMNPMDLKRGIDLAVAEVVKDMEKRAKKVELGFKRDFGPDSRVVEAEARAESVSHPRFAADGEPPDHQACGKMDVLINKLTMDHATIELTIC